MKLFDLHCDTATRIFSDGVSLKDSYCHVSLDKAAKYDKYVQLTAIFTDTKLSDEEGWERLLAVRENLLREAEKNGVRMIYTSHDLEEFEASDDKYAFILTVEDARILNGKIERVRELYNMGVRVITPLWGGETVIGGSHDTSVGLSDFGRAAVDEMLSCGIIPDISHASFASADEIISLAEEHGRVAFASHSDSYSVNPHSRNLTDDRFLRIAGRGGITGINLCPMHLREDSDAADIGDIVKNTLHFKAISENNVALGCDLDGTDLPHGIEGVGDLPKIAGALRENGVGEDFIDALFYNTAYRFMKDNLPTE